jgi:site-specific recombinase XerD
MFSNKNQEQILKLQKSLTHRNYSPNTIKIYIHNITIFLNYFSKDPLDISDEELIDFILKLKDSDKSPNTINLYKEAIKHFYKELY